MSASSASSRSLAFEWTATGRMWDGLARMSWAKMNSINQDSAESWETRCSVVDRHLPIENLTKKGIRIIRGMLRVATSCRDGSTSGSASMWVTAAAGGSHGGVEAVG